MRRPANPTLLRSLALGLPGDPNDPWVSMIREEVRFRRDLADRAEQEARDARRAAFPGIEERVAARRAARQAAAS